MNTTYALIQLTASWKPLMLGVSALYVTPGQRSIPSKTALLSDIYTATFSKVLRNSARPPKISLQDTQTENEIRTILKYKVTTCGTHFGETKLVASMTDNPDWDNRFMSSTLTAVGTISCNQSIILQISNIHEEQNSRKKFKLECGACGPMPNVMPPCRI